MTRPIIRIACKSRDLAEELEASLSALDRYPGARWAAKTELPNAAQLEAAHELVSGVIAAPELELTDKDMFEDAERMIT